MSGFNFEEKQKLYEILINYGVPVEPADETKEDWQLLRTLLAKQTHGNESIPNLNTENLQLLEKLVNQMDVVSTRILKDYTPDINNILKKWKEEDKSSSSQSDSDSDEEEKNNDFHVDKDRIRAAHFFEKSNQRLTFDPD